MKRRRHERGVSALEALAALALLAIVMIPLLELQSQIARGAIAQEGARKRLEAQRNALTLLDDLNPMTTPEGAIPLGGGASVRWRVTALSEETRSLAYPTGDGAFYVRLYEVAVTVSGPGVETSFDVERLGWRPVVSDEAASASPAGPRRAPGSRTP